MIKSFLYILLFLCSLGYGQQLAYPTSEVTNSFKLKASIQSSADLNTYTTDGLYHQNDNGQAASGSNYPLGVAGMLTVTTEGSMVYQTYQGYAENKTWERKYFEGTWETWKEIATTESLSTIYVDLANTQTITGEKAFSNLNINKDLRLNTLNPSILFNDTDGGIDTKKARVFWYEGGFLLRSLKDDNSPKTDLLNITETDVFYKNTSLLDFNNYDTIKDKKWVIFGDSFSDNLILDYPSTVISLTGMTGTVTHAVGGDRSVDQIADLNTLISSNANYFDDFDILTVLLGANDYMTGYPAGDMTDVVGAATYAGQLKYFVEKVLTSNPLIEIYILTPTEADNPGVFEYKTINGTGDYIEDFANIAKQVARLYNLKCIDLYHNLGFNETSIPLLTADGLHPNAEGDKRIGEILAAAFVNKTSNAEFEINPDFFLRSDIADQMDATLTMGNNIRFKLGTNSEFFGNNVNTYWDLLLGDIIIRDVETTRFTFGKATGNIAATSFNRVALTTGGSSTTFLNGTGTYTAPPKPTLSKSVTIPDIVATDDATLFYTPVAITVTSVNSHITGTTNVVFNINHASTRTGTGLDVFMSDIKLTSTAGQTNNTGFNDATIPANSWVWLDVVSVSGTPTAFHTTLIYTED